MSAITTTLKRVAVLALILINAQRRVALGVVVLAVVAAMAWWIWQ